MKFDDRVHSVTTPLEVQCSAGVTFGSGFFFGELAPGDGTDKPQWRTVEKTWVVSNKHVLCPGDPKNPQAPESITVNLREVKDGRVEWFPINYSSDQVRRLMRLHPDSSVDVAALDVTAHITDMMEEAKPLAYSIVTNSQFPGRNRLSVEVGSDVLVVGYPRGFYDSLNKFPIVKTGVIASRWGARFNGKRYCLIDAKLFPGSSGSLVITQPTQITVHQGELMFSKDKEFCVVGVYSGELYQTKAPVETEDAIVQKKEFLDLGAVWYPDTISETVAQAEPPFAHDN